MTPFRVGLTGGIAAGKSTVATWLREEGFTVVDADGLVAALYRPGGEGAQSVERLFGPAYLQPDGGVDHHRLAALVFSDAAARRQLEAAVHPLVKEGFEQQARQADGVAVLEASLLVEAGFAPEFDLIVTVEADPETRIQRAIARGLAPDDAAERLGAQTDAATRVAVANKVLHNDGSITQLRHQVDELIQEIKRTSADD